MSGLSCSDAWLGPRLVAVAVGLVATQLPAAFAEPCTLYKAGDVRNARENVKRYKWAQKIVSGWKRSVADAMRRDRRFLDEMISELTPWSGYGQNCPVCVGKKSSMGECGLWRWTIARPHPRASLWRGLRLPRAKEKRRLLHLSGMLA